MSGKDNKELKNTSLSDSRLPIVAVKPLQFGHHAAANETGINFSSLTWGAQDTIDTDISNPSASDILNAHLSIYKAGVSIHSSAKGKLSPLAYRINSTGIIWKDFVTEADEIFIITANNTWRTSLQCVDADVLNATGTLAANATEIDFVKVIKLPRTGQPCPLIVMIDESPKYMNTNNSTSNLDGDFYIKDTGNGFGRSIVMNSSASVIRNYQITGAGVIPQSAEASVLQKIETLYSMYETLAADMAQETGNPLSRYFTAPNSVDLAYFGNLVTNILNLDVPIITDWVTYAPVFGGYSVQPTVNTCKWRRVGADIEIDIRLTAGTVDGTVYTIPLPAGLSLANYASRAVGEFLGESATVAYQRGPIFASPSLYTQALVLLPGDNTWGGAGGLTGTNIGNGRTCLKAKVTIAGWSATQKMRTSLGV